MKEKRLFLARSKGFTLIELLVVIAVIGILLVGVIATINPVEQFKKSNDTKRKQHLGEIKNALELYYTDNGIYPVHDTNTFAINGVTWGGNWAPYMARVPQDPVSPFKYVYYSSPDGQSYYLYANLERGSKDPQACNSGAACTSLGGAGFPTAAACGVDCKYGISSPNVSP